MDLATIHNKFINGIPLTLQERAFYIRNRPEALAAFMVANNPGSVNFTLRQMGYSHLGFEPNAKALTTQLQLFIDRNTIDDFNEVVKKFQIETKDLPNDFVVELKKLFI